MSSTPTPPIRWPAEALWEAVAPVLPGFTVEVLPEIDSTNTELMRRLRGAEPRPEPILLVAEQQTAGRGRHGRQWYSQRGDSLTFSLGLPLQPAAWSGLSLVAGISVAESLNPLPAGAPRSEHIGLKWPNDLWLCGPEGERKLGGILVETASWDQLRFVIIGIGLNILTPMLPPTDTASNTAAAMSALQPGGLQTLLPGITAPEVLLRVVPPLVQAVQAFAQFGFAPFQSRFAALDVLTGRAVQLSDGTQGSAHGAGENGALLVHTAAGMKEITSSEVSVRPLPAAAGAPSKDLP